MLNQDERHAGLGGERAQELCESVEPTGGRTDPDAFEKNALAHHGPLSPGGNQNDWRTSSGSIEMNERQVHLDGMTRSRRRDAATSPRRCSRRGPGANAAVKRSNNAADPNRLTKGTLP